MNIDVIFKVLFKSKLFFILKILDSKWNMHKICNTDNSIVFCGPCTPWGLMHQRPQNLAKAFCYAGFDVFYCIDPYSIKIYPDNKVHGLHKTSEGPILYSSLRDWRFEKPPKILYCCYPWQHKYAKKLKKQHPETLIVYDIFDEISLFAKRKKDLSNYNSFMDEADLVLYSAENLKPSSDRSLYLPNGVDIGYFSKIKKNRELVVGYFGAIDKWFDFQLMKEVLSRDTKNLYIFIGHVSSSVVAELDDMISEFKNLIYLGKIAYSKLPFIASIFDVGIIPFKINDITRSVNPIKLYEYLSLGCKVLSTHLPEVEKTTGIGSIELVKNSSEFIYHLEKFSSLAGIEQSFDALYAFSWENLAGKIVNEIN